MFNKIDNKYYLNYDFNILDPYILAYNSKFINFMINNTFYDKNNVEQKGIDFLVKYVNIDLLIMYEGITNFYKIFNINIFKNPNIFEIDHGRTFEEYDKFITNLFM